MNRLPRCWLMLAITFLVASLPLHGQEPTPTTLRLGTWNLEWLGSPDKRATQPDPDLIAKYIIQSEVAAFALNEVTQNILTDEGWGNRTLADALRLVSERTDGDWRHVLFMKENRDEREQLVGVAWNAKRVQRVGAPFRLPVHRTRGVGEQFNRHPWGLKLSCGAGLTDFVVVPLHLKSNRGGFEQTSGQRAAEARGLIRALGPMQNEFSDDDVVLLGDTNFLKEDEPAVARFTGSGFRDLNGGQFMTWIASGEYKAAPFDRIFVPDDQPEFKESVLRVMKDNPTGDEAGFRAKLSDHYMITTQVRVLEDDD